MKSELKPCMNRFCENWLKSDYDDFCSDKCGTEAFTEDYHKRVDELEAFELKEGEQLEINDILEDVYGES